MRPCGKVTGRDRLFNQTESMSILDIAKVAADLHRDALQVEHLANPRVELESHYYNVTHTGLGLQPHLLSDTLLTLLYAIADRYKQRADPEKLVPTVQWRRDSARG
jgi:UDP-sulfoquinovose synthase